jgi:hypothetical protein
MPTIGQNAPVKMLVSPVIEKPASPRAAASVMPVRLRASAGGAALRCGVTAAVTVSALRFAR